MATRIEDRNEMLKLYKEGKIHKATYYRGLKRGYVIIDYHIPHSQSISSDWHKDPETCEIIIGRLYKIASNVVKEMSKVYDATMVADLAHDTFLYLIERKQPFDQENLGKFFSVAKSYMRGELRYGFFKKWGWAGKYKKEVPGDSLLEFIADDNSDEL